MTDIIERLTVLADDMEKQHNLSTVILLRAVAFEIVRLRAENKLLRDERKGEYDGRL